MEEESASAGESCGLELERGTGGTLAVRLRGAWRVGCTAPRVEEVVEGLGPDVRRLAVDGAELSGWDTALLAFLLRVVRAAGERGIELDLAGLPEGVRRLVSLATTVQERAEPHPRRRVPLLARIGAPGSRVLEELRATLEFVGKATLSFGRFLGGRACFRSADFWRAVQECGPNALGIVGLISFLIGLILAFVGAAQLKLLGAEILIANGVVLAMAREMSAIMTGIVLAGRTGAAYAAELGTMTVHEEIDSLETFGIDPMDFLVLPRMLALLLMMPLLTIYSNVMGVIGGFAVGAGLLGISPTLYWNQTLDSVGVSDFGVGMIKAGAVGALVAIAGCMRGMRCGRSSQAVGLATTSAVVTSIVWIILADAVFDVIFQMLGV